MSDILKKPYEISIWEDVLTFIGESGATYTVIDDSVNEPIIAQFYDERKLYIIGSDTMNTPIRAMSPKLSSNINGSSTLTFTLYHRYWDDEVEDFLDNPFSKILVNETKIKLRYGAIDDPDCKWYDLVIKNIVENSANKGFEYTAKDMFINELSKSGFDLEFSAELENNTGTITELGQTVLEGSDWKLGDDCSTLLQYKEEPLYKVKVSENITGKDMLTGESSDLIQGGQYIYVFYSQLANKEPNLQFLYNKEGYIINEDRVIINAPASEISDKGSNYLLDQSFSYIITDEGNRPSFASSIELISEYRGARLVRKARTVYDKVSDRYVYTYKKGSEEYYGYNESKYIPPLAVTNYVTNPSNFISTVGWKVGAASANSDSFPTLEAKPYPDILNSSFTDFETTLQINFTDVGQAIYNSGIADNRSTIANFTKDEEYVFRIELKELAGSFLEPISPQNLFNIQIAEYELTESKYEFSNLIFDFSSATWQSQIISEQDYNSSGDLITKNRTFYYAKARCLKSLSYAELIVSKIGLFVSPLSTSLNKTWYIIEAQFFPYLEEYSGSSDSMCIPGKLCEPRVETYYYYYPKNNSYSSVDEIQYSYIGSKENNEYVLVYDTNSSDNDQKGYEKIRSITASESNRFNLLQTLCETFECWLDVKIEHELSGKIKTNFIYEVKDAEDNYTLEESSIFEHSENKKCVGKRQQKQISFKEFVGKDNFAGFKYGINLQEIKRTLDSDGIVSKIIVKSNSNEFAKDGFCSIARARENPSGENFIYDFTYYINQGLLNLSQITNDLYSSGFNGYIGYYTKLSELNSNREGLIDEQSKILISLSKAESDVSVYSEAMLNAEEQLASEKVSLEQTTGGFTYNNFITQPTNLSEEQLKSYEAWKKEEIVIQSCTKIATLQKKSLAYSKLKESAVKTKEALESRQTEIEDILKQKLIEKERLNKNFYHKYSRFIQEGSWISEDYIDDELYYLDAESTLHTSSQPKVTYDIKVIELSQIQEYENYTFALGDKTYIEDTEFFGWFIDAESGLRTPYKEEVIIAETVMALDQPEQNQLKIQNYKTQFEDLFQRITATTQAIEYSTGQYNKASGIVTTAGTIDISTIQNSIANNALILQNAKDQSVIWDESGITTTSLTKPNEIVRIVSGGIMLSKDGGTTWSTGITGSGINANYITTGQLDTNVIRILNGVHATFRWDNLGITAYKFTPLYDSNGVINGGKDFKSGIFTRFDQYGIYGIDGYENFDANKPDEDGTIGESKIWDTAKFALTWRGFSLRTNKVGGYVRISSEDDIQVIAGDQPRIKLGCLSSDGSRYGLRLLSKEGKVVMETDSDGLLYLEKYMRIGPDSTNPSRDRVKFGIVENYTIDEQEDAISKILSIKDSDLNQKAADSLSLEENEVLSIYDDGTILAKRIIINGGSIGNMTIQEIESLNLKVNIDITEGNDIIFRNSTDSETKELRGYLYDGTKEIVEIEGKTITWEWTLDGKKVGSESKLQITANEITSPTGAALIRCYITVSDNETGESVMF